MYLLVKLSLHVADYCFECCFFQFIDKQLDLSESPRLTQLSSFINLAYIIHASVGLC